MASAQGSLEYIIIITVAIAILAVIASFVIGYFSTQSDQFYYSSCSTAASLCKNALITDARNECPTCDNACNYTNGTEIFAKATVCCKLGKSTEIYRGSLATDCVPISSPEIICLESDGVTPVPEGACSITRPGKRCVNSKLRPACSTGCSCNTSIYQKCDTANDYCYNISFTETNISTLSGGVNSIAFGDANNDSQNEIVVGLGGVNSYQIDLGYLVINTTIMYSYSAGTWTENNISNARSINSVAIGDADNLPGTEVVVGTKYHIALRMFKYINNAWQDSILADTPNLIASSVAIGDADNDLKNEVVVGFWSSSSSVPPNVTLYEYDTVNMVWTNNPVKTFPPSLNTAPYAVAIGDADNDGSNEIVVGLNATSNETRMYKYAAESWIETNVSDVPSGVWTLAVGDADNVDGNNIVAGLGKADIAPSNATREYNLSNGVWQELNLSHPNLPGISFSVTSIAIGDVDKDGKNEVIASYFAIGTAVKIYYYDPTTGQWPRTSVNYQNGGFSDPPFSVAAGDINNDGYYDVFVGMNSVPPSITESTLRVYAPYRVYDY